MSQNRERLRFSFSSLVSCSLQSSSSDARPWLEVWNLIKSYFYKQAFSLSSSYAACFIFFNLLCFMKTLIFAFTILAVILLYLSFTLNLLVKLIIISQHCVTLKEMTNPVDTMCWRGKQVKVWRVDLWNRTVNRDHSGLVPSPQLPVNYLRVCSSPNYFFNTSIIFYYSSFASYRIILMFSW